MRISHITIGKDAFQVELDDGQLIEVSYRLFPRLKSGTCEELNRWSLIGDGEGVHWESLDEDISLENILAGVGSHESESSLRKWLGTRNRSALNA